MSESNDLEEYYQRKGVKVVRYTPTRCPKCRARGEDGRPVLYKGQNGLVRYHECPRCVREDGSLYYFVSVEFEP